MAEFECDVGLSYLRRMHAAAHQASERSHVLFNSSMRDIPLILETPAYDAPRRARLGETDWHGRAWVGMGVWCMEVYIPSCLSGCFTSAAKAEDEELVQGGEIEETECGA